MESLEIMPVRVKIASILKKAIYSGEYKPGEELRLTDVAAQLGVSRTPVREAFQQLAGEGLITLRMNKGAIVNSIDRNFVRDCFEMRILLESEAARRAAENGMETDALLDRLTVLQRSFDASVDTFDAVSRTEYEELNQDIHMAIWKASGNQKLRAYLMDLWNGPSTGHSVSEIRQHYIESTKEHIDILNAVKTGNAEKARRAMAGHISRSMDNILALYPAPEEAKQ